METAYSYRDARGPDGTLVYAIGDVHGRLDLLAEMHARIAADIMRLQPADWRIIHLGDYVDRGPDSKGVHRVADPQDRHDGRNISLAGNHDIGFLDFLAEPKPDGLFAVYGGVQTAQSYGVELDLVRHGQVSARAVARSARPCRGAMANFCRR